MPRGRPTAYKPEYVEQIKPLAIEGKTEQEMADSLGVGLATLKRWKGAHPDFRAALNGGRDEHDAEVEVSLATRAKGFTGPDGKYYPPDVTACIFWLKNRQSAKWRDKQDIQHSGEVAINVSSKDAQL